jgi:hypothetical protein
VLRTSVTPCDATAVGQLVVLSGFGNLCPAWNALASVILHSGFCGCGFLLFHFQNV